MYNTLLLFSGSTEPQLEQYDGLNAVLKEYQVEWAHSLERLEVMRRVNNCAAILILYPDDRQVRYQLLNIIRNVRGRLKSPFLLIYSPEMLNNADLAYFAGDQFVLQLPGQLHVLQQRIARRVNDCQLLGAQLSSSSVDCKLTKTALIRFSEDAEVTFLNNEAVKLSSWVFGSNINAEEQWQMKASAIVERGKVIEGQFTLNESVYQFSYQPQSTGGLLEIKIIKSNQ